MKKRPMIIFAAIGLLASVATSSATNMMVIIHSTTADGGWVCERKVLSIHPTNLIRRIDYIDDSGNYSGTYRLMPAFRCIKDEDQLNVADATDVTVIFTSTVFDTHSAFNTNTFSYDVPTNGLYQFNAGIYWFPIDATRIARLKVEQYGDGFTNVVLQKLERSNAADDSIVLNGSFMLTCTSTQSVRVVAQHANGDGTPDIRLFEALWGTYFDGHMVGRAE